MMTRCILFLTLAMLTGCRSSSDAVGPQRTERAFIYDTSQYNDGCEPYIVLDTGDSTSHGTQYKPSPATLLLVQRLSSQTTNSSVTPVLIQFMETPNQVKIQCGWASPIVTEIQVLTITKR